METAEHSIIIHHHFNHHYEISTGILWVESCVLNPTMSLKSSIRRVVQTKNWRKFWQGILHDWDTFGDMIMENTACKIWILCAQVSIRFGPWWIQSRSFDQMMKFSPGFPQITETIHKNEAFIRSSAWATGPTIWWSGQCRCCPCSHRTGSRIFPLPPISEPRSLLGSA